MRGITLLLLFGWLTIASAQLPNLGRNSSLAFSPTKERQIGKLFMNSIRKKMPLITDPIINNYINNLGHHLVSHTKHIFRFHFFVIHNNSVNAFSCPGGYVGINSDLILTTKTESELAAVLAHEITHVNQHHIARAIARSKQMTIPNIAALIAAITIGTQTNANVGSGAAAAVMAGNTQGMINFTRSNEKEADRIGMETLYRAGFNPYAMPSFLTRMQKTSFFATDSMPAFLQDHPTTVARIADSDNRANLYQKKSYHSSTSYFLICARMRALASDRRFALKYFYNKLTKKSYKNRQSAQYGYALALSRNKKFASANKIVRQLVKKHPYQPIYQILLANILQKNHQQQKALAILQSNIELFPENYPLVITYAKSLLACKKNNKARIFLIQHLASHENDLTINDLLAKAQANSGHLADAYQTRAKMFMLVNNNRMAIVQLQQALEQPSLSADNKIIINSKIAMLRGKLQKQGNLMNH